MAVEPVLPCPTHNLPCHEHAWPCWLGCHRRGATGGVLHLLNPQQVPCADACRRQPHSRPSLTALAQLPSPPAHLPCRCRAGTPSHQQWHDTRLQQEHAIQHEARASSLREQ